MPYVPYHTIPYLLQLSAPRLLSAMSRSPCVVLSVMSTGLSVCLPSAFCSIMALPYSPPPPSSFKSPSPFPVPIPIPLAYSPSLFPNSLIPLCLFFYCNKISHFLSSLAPPSLSPSPPSYSVLEGFLLFLTGFPVVRAPFFHSA